MKHVFFLIIIGLATLQVSLAQNNSGGLQPSVDVPNVVAADSAITLDTLDLSDYNASNNKQLGQEPTFIGANWPWLVGLLVALLCGVLIGKFINQKSEKFIIKEEVTTTTETNAIIANLTQPKTIEYNAELSALQVQFNRIKDFDSLYFDHASKKLIEPFWQQVEAKNTKEMIEIALKSMAHFTALTRYKKGLDQKFDVYNLHYLTEQAQWKSSEAKVISKETYQDDIPNHIQAIVTLLKANNSNGLDDTSFSGYSIKSI